MGVVISPAMCTHPVYSVFLFSNMFVFLQFKQCNIEYIQHLADTWLSYRGFNVTKGNIVLLGKRPKKKKFKM